jgi:hypothetical protein
MKRHVVSNTLPWALLVSMLAISCSATQQESNQTWKNRQQINGQIPVPDMAYSQRRYVMAEYYKSLARPHLPSCHILLPRGNAGGIAYFDGNGASVNLSNQMTAPEISEPDGIYTGNNDQTLSVAQNGTGYIAEIDTVTIVGKRCPKPGLKTLQEIIDTTSGQKAEVNFNPPKGLVLTP